MDVNEKKDIYTFDDVKIIIGNIYDTIKKIGYTNDNTVREIDYGNDDEYISYILKNLDTYDEMRPLLSVENADHLSSYINCIFYNYSSFSYFFYLSMLSVKKKKIMLEQYNFLDDDSNTPYYELYQGDQMLKTFPPIINPSQCLLDLKNSHPSAKLLQKMCDHQYQKYYKYSNHREECEVKYFDFYIDKYKDASHAKILLDYYVKKDDHVNVYRLLKKITELNNYYLIIDSKIYYEYLLLVQKEKNKILEQEIERLKTELTYRPDGEGMKECEASFYTTREKLKELL